MDKNTISLCMIVKNEENHLNRCLKSIQQVVNEIIIIDTGSTDNTIPIAKSYGANVISIPWKSDFAFARNAGLSRAKGTWILILDADEELDAQHRKELRICSEHTEYEGFFLQIHNHSGSSQSSPVSTINPILRMFRNDPKHRFRGKIHEQIAYSIMEHNPHAALHITNVVVHHYGYEESLVIQRDKIRRNLDLLIQSLDEEPKDPFHHYNIAVEYMRVGNYDAALKHLQQSMSFAAPEVSYSHLLYKYKARCLLSLGRYPEAVQACERAFLLYPDYTDLYHLKAVILLGLGSKQDARDTFLQAIRLGPAPIQFHTESGIGTFRSSYGLGQVYEELGDDSNAVYWYGEAVKHNSQMTPPLQRMFRIMKCAGSESDIPTLLQERFSMSSPDAAIKVITLLMEEGCYSAAHSLLIQLDGDEFREIRNEKIRMCRILSGSERKTPKNLENEKIWYWLGQKEPEIDSKDVADHSGNTLDEFELTVKSSYYNGNPAKALKLLKNWQPAAAQEAKTMQDDEYRRSRIWIALADAKIGLPDKHSPHYMLYRNAKLSLPLFRGY